MRVPRSLRVGARELIGRRLGGWRRSARFRVPGAVQQLAERARVRQGRHRERRGRYVLGARRPP